MATTQDALILKTIQSQYNSAKDNHDVIENSLAADMHQRKAIISVRNAAIWSIVGAILGYLVTLIMGLVIPAILHNSQLTGSLLSGALVLVGLTIVVVYFGIRIYALSITPNFLRGALIYLLISDLIFFEGLVSLIAAIFVVIALVRWSDYHDWFYSIKVKNQKTKESSRIPLSAKPMYTKSNLAAVIIVTGAIFLVMGLIIGDMINPSPDEQYDKGYNAGLSYGKQLYASNGYDDGVRNGYQSGFADAQKCAVQIANEFDAFGAAITTMDNCYRY